MMAPLLKYGVFGVETSFVVAFLLGLAFGVALERAGFGSARKLVSQFYLDDLAVFKVMFTAIVTAMLGVTYLSWVGFLDLSKVYLVPTFLPAQVVGGLVLGVGFVVGGYCPGTALAATATGRMDALVYGAGLYAGTWFFAETYRFFKPFLSAGSLGQVTIWQYFNLPYGLVVFAVVLMAIGGFAAAGWLEKSRQRLHRRLAVAALAIGAVAIAATPTTGGRTTIDSREMADLMVSGADRVDVRTLAGWIIESRADIRLVDVRDPAAFASGPRIPSSENIPLSSLVDAGLGRAERVLLVSDDEARAAQAWFVLRAEGYKGVAIVRGGLRAWQEEVVSPLVAGVPAPERARLEAMSRHFGGSPRSESAATVAVTPATPAVAPTVPASAGGRKTAPAKKREGC